MGLGRIGVKWVTDGRCKLGGAERPVSLLHLSITVCVFILLTWKRLWESLESTSRNHDICGVVDGYYLSKLLYPICYQFKIYCCSYSQQSKQKVFYHTPTLRLSKQQEGFKQSQAVKHSLAVQCSIQTVPNTHPPTCSWSLVQVAIDNILSLKSTFG